MRVCVCFSTQEKALYHARPQKQPGAYTSPCPSESASVKALPQLHVFSLRVQGGAPHVHLDLENHKGKVTEWLQNEPVQGEIRRQFKKFLRNFKDNAGDRVYVRVVENMVLGEYPEVARIVGVPIRVDERRLFLPACLPACDCLQHGLSDHWLERREGQHACLCLSVCLFVCLFRRPCAPVCQCTCTNSNILT
jgi:hypothetical protein